MGVEMIDYGCRFNEHILDWLYYQLRLDLMKMPLRRNGGIVRNDPWMV